MKRFFFTLLCLGVLSTVSGCYIDPAATGVSTSIGVGVGTYVEADPYWDYYPYRHYGWYDKWRYRRLYRPYPYPYRYRSPYYGR